MHLHSAAACAVVACGGLVSAQLDAEPLQPMEKRDLEARDLLLIKAMPQPPVSLQRPNMLASMPIMQMLQQTMGPMPMGPSMGPSMRFAYPGKRFGRPPRAKSLASSQTQPTIPKAVLNNPNGYSVTTKVSVKPNGPPPASTMSATGWQVPSHAVIEIPLGRTRRLGATKATKPLPHLVKNPKRLKEFLRKSRKLRKAHQVVAKQQLKNAQAVKQRAMKAALAAKARGPLQSTKLAQPIGPKSQKSAKLQSKKGKSSSSKSDSTSEKTNKKNKKKSKNEGGDESSGEDENDDTDSKTTEKSSKEDSSERVHARAFLPRAAEPEPMPEAEAEAKVVTGLFNTNIEDLKNNKREAEPEADAEAELLTSLFNANIKDIKNSKRAAQPEAEAEAESGADPEVWW